ncbi:MAG: thiamine pyrophosphate-binding protein [Chloroflexota bacterium]|nr:MAG: thiamine pyrophosphate-binding protein [Chloroflexota bacterium]
MAAKVADRLVRLLAEAGIREIFGLPGGENLAILEAIRSHGLRFVLAHHESSAVFMADATSRLLRRPSACLATLGPGAANALPGIAHAFLDRSPVLLITAQHSATWTGSHSHQRLELRSLFRPVTKASLQATSGNVDALLRAALQTAQSGRPGPVHVCLSAEDAESNVRTNRVSYPEQSGFQPDEATRRRIVEIFREANRPAIVVGLGLEPETPYDILRQLAERANAPVITTPKAKGALNDDHPLSAGTIGLTHEDPAYRLLDESDCILAVGLDVVELVRPWRQSAPLIWLARWPNEDPKLRAVAEWVGPLSPILKALGETQYATGDTWGVFAVMDYVRQKTSSWPDRSSPFEGRVAPTLALEAIRENTPDDAFLVTDVGSHKILAALEWPCFRPNSYLVSNGLSIMGYGLPAAVAVAISRPGSVVVALLGDGGLAMSLGELRTLAEVDSPVIVVVLRDDALELIRSKQYQRGFRPFGTTFAGPDLRPIAAAYGLSYHYAASARQCASHTRVAVRSGRSALIEVPVDVAGYPTAA